LSCCVVDIACQDLLELLLGCAILCDDHALFITRILNDLEVETQAGLEGVVESAIARFGLAAPAGFSGTKGRGTEGAITWCAERHIGDEEDITEAEPSEVDAPADSEEPQTKQKPRAKRKKRGKKKKKKKQIRKQKPVAATKAASGTPAPRTSSISSPTRRPVESSPAEHPSGDTNGTSNGTRSSSPLAASGGVQGPLADFRTELGALSTASGRTGGVPQDRQKHEKLAEASRQRKQAKEAKHRRDAARAAKQAKLQRAKQAKTAKRVTARLTDAKEYTFIHKQRFDAASGFKLEDRPPDVMSRDEMARRDAKMAKISAQRNNDVFLSKVDRYTSQKHTRVHAAQAKLKEMERHRHGMIVDPVHNPTVVHKAKKLSETDLMTMGQRMNSWAQKHESSLQSKREQEEQKMLAQITGTPEINGKPMPRSAATKAETIERLHAERQVHDAR
jgi:hypothetical protein